MQKKQFTNDNNKQKEPDQKTLLDVKLYDTYRPPKTEPQIQTMIPINNQMLMFPNMGYSYVPNQPQIIKNYNISMPNPTGSHATMAALYEDILPTKLVYQTANTLNERFELCNYIRSILVRTNDGEDISLDVRSKNSLLHHIKLVELNPYANNPFNDNPYSDLAVGFLLYNSCYPIRYDSGTNKINCSQHGTGINVRIYRLSVAEYNAKRLTTNVNCNKYDVWREIEYYEYVRENILKEKMCPNFALMYSWFVDEQCDIDFDKLSQFTAERPCPLATANASALTLLNTYAKKSAIVLTEAPNVNLYTWASKIYEEDGIRNIMINTGYYNDNVWKSVLFQIMAALYALQIKNIYIRNFTIKDNVYIKNLNASRLPTGHVSGYWLYKIDNIDYFVPNYGYLVLIDSKFKEVQVPTLLENNKYSRKHRLQGSVFGNDISYSNSILKTFKKCINSNSFGNSERNQGFVQPSEKIMDLLGKIDGDVSSDQDLVNEKIDKNVIGYYIHKYMRSFLHNRIGTWIKESEKNNIRPDRDNSFAPGELILYEIDGETMKWGLYVRPYNNGYANSSLILTKSTPDSDDIITEIKSNTVLRKYSYYKQVEQNYKMDGKTFSAKNKLETYIMNYNN